MRKPEDTNNGLKNYDRIQMYPICPLPVRTLNAALISVDLESENPDVEHESPRQKKYFEVGSCSNLGDAQARRLKMSMVRMERNILLIH